MVGGGAVGCGIAYHLATGWDTMLVERDELTAVRPGTPGLLPLFNMG